MNILGFGNKKNKENDEKPRDKTSELGLQEARARREYEKYHSEIIELEKKAERAYLVQNIPEFKMYARLITQTTKFSQVASRMAAQFGTLKGLTQLKGRMGVLLDSANDIGEQFTQSQDVEPALKKYEEVFYNINEDIQKIIDVTEPLTADGITNDEEVSETEKQLIRRFNMRQGEQKNQIENERNELQKLKSSA